MQVIINGESLDVESNLTLLALVSRIAKTIEQVAVEHNGKVVDHEEFAKVTINSNDRLEIVHFVGGG